MLNEENSTLIPEEDEAILRNRRMDLAKTQKQIAEAAQIPLQSYQRFESGERKIRSASFDIACRVIDALRIDIERFYRHQYWVDAAEFSLIRNIKCPYCNEIQRMDFEDECVLSEENRPMGIGNLYEIETECKCVFCGKLFSVNGQISEYPVGTLEYEEINVVK